MENNLEVMPENIEVPELDKKKELGASLVEYGLLVALIAVICIAAVRLLGTSVSTQFSGVASGIN